MCCQRCYYDTQTHFSGDSSVLSSPSTNTAKYTHTHTHTHTDGDIQLTTTLPSQRKLPLNPSSTRVPPSTPISSHSFPASKEETALCCTQSSALTPSHFSVGFLDGTVVKNLPAKAGNAGDEGLIPGSGRSPREGNGNPPQYSCLEYPMGRGAWWAIYSP